jgi:hypothetical protein
MWSFYHLVNVITMIRTQTAIIKMITLSGSHCIDMSVLRAEHVDSSLNCQKKISGTILKS